MRQRHNYIYILITLAGCTNTPKQIDMPDFCQVDQRYGAIVGDGRTICGPVAVSNALICLARKGHPNLVEGPSTDAPAQADLIRTLCSPAYYDARPDDGIDPLDLMIGLDNYLRSQGYAPQIDYRGWKPGGPYTSADKIDTQWLTNALKKDAGLLFHVGWYRRIKDATPIIFNRIGGHYVTVADLDVHTDGRISFTFTDPGKCDNFNPRLEYGTMTTLPVGKVDTCREYPARSADGDYLIEGIRHPSSADTILLDGAIKFKLHP